MGPVDRMVFGNFRAQAFECEDPKNYPLMGIGGERGSIRRMGAKRRIPVWSHNCCPLRIVLNGGLYPNVSSVP